MQALLLLCRILGLGLGRGALAAALLVFTAGVAVG